MGYSVKKKTRFSQLHTTRRGDVGEMIMNAHLHGQGWHVYPHFADMAAPVDCVGLRSNEDGFDVVAFEAKTYPRRFSYTQTGIDTADYWTYREIIKTIPLTIVFADPFERVLYALAFAKHYDKAIFEPGKVYFDLELCKPLRDLTADELRRIGWHPTPYYKNVQKFFL